jgi:hypothetical protein
MLVTGAIGFVLGGFTVWGVQRLIPWLRLRGRDDAIAAASRKAVFNTMLNGDH